MYYFIAKYIPKLYKSFMSTLYEICFFHNWTMNCHRDTIWLYTSIENKHNMHAGNILRGRKYHNTCAFRCIFLQLIMLLKRKTFEKFFFLWAT